MKKQILFGVLLGVFLCSAVVVYAAVSWNVANQITVSWDAVTTKSDGVPLGPTDIVRYEVFLVNNGTDPQKTNPASLGIVDDPPYTLTLNTEGSYIIGVQALRYIVENSTETLVGKSNVSWSDDPNVSTEFGVRYFLPPADTFGIRLGS